ncbi:MAG: hypothetical protein HETSPECPRED_008487 [Heterodermia speciosa]|uniref:Uncharacterized protein n=1 Tax=Heterodermia speciosa TaxID=116794 RepID=A0A8H3ITJ3_9LECA|nr:MAG: hypothetical protein HETSPECPRED_008487 [Heterodermia speciosa]
MSFQCSNAVQYPEIPHERVAVAHTACSACTVRGLDRAESENFLAGSMDLHPSNEYHLGLDDNADAAFAIERHPNIPGPLEAPLVLTSADELPVMSMAD